MFTSQMLTICQQLFSSSVNQLFLCAAGALCCRLRTLRHQLTVGSSCRNLLIRCCCHTMSYKYVCNTSVWVWTSCYSPFILVSEHSEAPSDSSEQLQAEKLSFFGTISFIFSFSIHMITFQMQLSRLNSEQFSVFFTAVNEFRHRNRRELKTVCCSEEQLQRNKSF